jgi:perosamine synthetase
MKRIPVAGPWITRKEVDYVTDAVTNAWYDKAGVWHARFEKAFADHLGVKHAMALPSCTSALHLALLACGVGPGDEVVVPESTWIASAAPVTYVGATPVFADVDPVTWCMSAESFERCLTPRTKAAIPVDLYGGMPDWSALRRVADRAGVVLIEDAAEAIGSMQNGRRAGAFGRVGTFSFHGSKTLTTGEGGMLVTDDTALFERCQFLRDHGRAPGRRQFWNVEVAHKYKMSAMQAALGLAQLERVEELVARKREAFGWYRDALSSIDGLTLNAEPPGTRNSYWMATVVPDASFGVSKHDLVERLGERGIDARPFFHPLSELPAYANSPHARGARERNPVAYRLSATGVNLPSSLSITREDVAVVAAALREVLLGARRPAASRAG